MNDFRTAPELSEFSRDEFNRLCCEYSSEILFLLDSEMTICHVTPSFWRVMGIDPEKCIGRGFGSGWIAAVDLPRAELDWAEVISGKSFSRRRYSCLTEGGTEAILEMNGTPVLINGRIGGALVSARDVTCYSNGADSPDDIVWSLRKSLDVTIKTISRTIDFKDPYTAGHQQRVSDLARAIATELGLPLDTINGIRMAGIVHDIGKISIPSEILSKPGRLHLAEFELIKIHPIIGFDILSSIDFPWPVAAAVLQHHERADGSGYPYGITGTHIISEASIIGVADVVEALASHRPYRARIGTMEALEEIEKNAGILYDNDIVDACLRLFRERNYQLSLQ